MSSVISDKGSVKDYILRFFENKDRYYNRTKPSFMLRARECWWVKAEHILPTTSPQYAVARSILIYSHFEPYGA